jgi:O-antigen ligase
MLSGEKDYNFTERGGRILVWQRGVIHMIRHPITGVGIANFSTAEGQMLEEEGIRGAWMAPHNAFLQAGVELGVPGFITFLLLAWHLIRTSWRNARRRDARPVTFALFGAVVGYLVGSFFLSNAFSATIFLLAGLVAVRPLSARSDAPAPAPRPQATRHVASPRRRGGPIKGHPLAGSTGW